jgi:hypothetical protein
MGVSPQPTQAGNRQRLNSETGWQIRRAPVTDQQTGVINGECLEPIDARGSDSATFLQALKNGGDPQSQLGDAM